MSLMRTIQIRLSREQYNKIKEDCKSSGFYSLSGYLRYLALGRNYILEYKINEIYKKVVGKTKNKKVKITNFPPFVEI